MAIQQPSVVTESRHLLDTKRFPVPDVSDRIPHPEQARFSEAADIYHPQGTVGHPKNRSVMEAHADFFDRNKDGIITPIETFQSFRALGFNVFLSAFAVLVINGTFAIPCNGGPFPIVDPLFRLWVSKIHFAKHGSDTGTVDYQGRFIPQKFEEIFARYDPQNTGKLHWRDLWQMTSDLKVGYDFYGWFAAKFEWFATWYVAHDEEGYVTREQIRGIYDGSFFYQVEAQRKQQNEAKKLQ